jgi:hypothetical protein
MHENSVIGKNPPISHQMMASDVDRFAPISYNMIVSGQMKTLFSYVNIMVYERK